MGDQIGTLRVHRPANDASVARLGRLGLRRVFGGLRRIARERP